MATDPAPLNLVCACDDVEAAADSYEQAALDLAVGIDGLGQAIDRLLTQRRDLLQLHRELARAARRVVQAYHDERLDGALLDALDVALAKTQALESL